MSDLGAMSPDYMDVATIVQAAAKSTKVLEVMRVLLVLGIDAFTLTGFGQLASTNVATETVTTMDLDAILQDILEDGEVFRRVFKNKTASNSVHYFQDADPRIFSTTFLAIMVTALKPFSDTYAEYFKRRLNAIGRKTSYEPLKFAPGKDFAEALNTTFNFLTARYGKAILQALNLLSQTDSSISSMLGNEALYLMKGAGGLGYRAVDTLLVKPNSDLLRHSDLIGEVQALTAFMNSFKEVMDAAPQELKDPDYYAFIRGSAPSFTDLNRRIPLLLAITGKLIEMSGVPTDKMWAGFNTSRYSDAILVRYTKIHRAANLAQLVARQPWIEQMPDDLSSMNDTPLEAWCPTFASQFLNWQRELNQSDVQHIFISWLELVFVVLGMGWTFPHPHAGRSGTAWRSTEEAPVASHSCCTVATYQAYLKGMCKAISVWVGVSYEAVCSLDLGPLGVHMPLVGLALHCTDPILSEARKLLASFTATRTVRTVNDLSRPPWR